jgi:hypothetical protein
MTILTQKNAARRRVGLILFAFSFASPTLRAQIGNDNPTGPAGVFNGNVTTGCSYDPYTGNARRSIKQFPEFSARVAARLSPLNQKSTVVAR